MREEMCKNLAMATLCTRILGPFAGGAKFFRSAEKPERAHVQNGRANSCCNHAETTDLMKDLTTTTLFATTCNNGHDERPYNHRPE